MKAECRVQSGIAILHSALCILHSTRLFGAALTTTAVSRDQCYQGKLYQVLTFLPVGVRNGPGAPVLTMI